MGKFYSLLRLYIRLKRKSKPDIKKISILYDKLVEMERKTEIKNFNSQKGNYKINMI